MPDSRIALATAAHPDDVEFMMAGTLALLADAGYECHIFTIGNGNCGTVTHTHEEIIRIRGAEGHSAASVIGATYHEGLANDIEIFYDPELLRRVTAVVREVQPQIVLTQSPQDYMEDHQNSSRLTVSACFCRGMRNWVSHPWVAPTMQDVYLYHCQPYGSVGPLREHIAPSFIVDVTDKIDVKEEMLRRHASQKEWLDVSQGKDAYLAAMREGCAGMGKLAPRPVAYGEGFRQHLHVGLSAKDGDPLGEVLRERVQNLWAVVWECGSVGVWEFKLPHTPILPYRLPLRAHLPPQQRGRWAAGRRSRPHRPPGCPAACSGPRSAARRAGRSPSWAPERSPSSDATCGRR